MPSPNPGSPEAVARVVPGLVVRFDDTPGRLGTIRVMAVADNYAMVRRPGCMPFIQTVRAVAALLATPVQQEPGDG